MATRGVPGPESVSENESEFASVMASAEADGNAYCGSHDGADMSMSEALGMIGADGGGD